ncbi:MAG TPA: flagellar hook-basal body complex protein [Urbifossiella sp.]|jgi:flagellar basal-body rod protein FlgG|nr:flagellar hook-basal body complex protein [Urbifossiella sp.]
MLIGLYTSNAGLQAASNYLDVLSNNITNVDTPGYKTVESHLQDFPYTGPSPSSAADPTGSQLGSGAVLNATYGVFTQGPINNTGQPLDVAIQGQGFLSVSLPGGTTGYTRAGNLSLDANGNLVTSDGFPLSPPITVPTGSTNVSVAADGTVTATSPTGDPITVGALDITTFRNPAGLVRIGQTTFEETPASGPGTTTSPGVGIAGTFLSGALEGSNVEIASELVNLIIAQQSFSANNQAVLVSSETLQATTDLIQ